MDLELTSLLVRKDVNFLIAVSILLLSSGPFNWIQNGRTKKWSSFLLSILLILASSEFTVSQLLITLAYGLALASTIRYLKFDPKLPTICYLIAFGLITLLRIQFIDKSIHSTAQTNLVLMMMLLRAISLSFDLQEFDIEGKRQLNFENVFAYLFCHCGLIMGPFYRYRIYQDWIRFQTNAGELENLNKQCRRLILNKLPLLVAMVLFFLIGNHYFPFESIVINHESGFLNLFIQTMCTFYTYRARLYIGFILAEICLIANRMGIYPAQLKPMPGIGPTIDLASTSDDDHNSKATIYSAGAIECFSSVRDVELTGSIQKSIRNWNGTVQFWLHYYCYRKLKGSSDLMRIYSTLFIR